MADDERGAREELEGCDDLGADHRMLAHQRPLLRLQSGALAQDRLRHADLADVVEQPGLRHHLDLVAGDAQDHAEPPAPRAHALGVAPRVRILGLERVGEAEQRLADRAAELVIEPLHVLGVAQRLQLGGYSGNHAAPGSRLSTSESSRTGEKGLVR